MLGLGGGAPDIIAVYSQVKNGAYGQTFGFVVGMLGLVGRVSDSPRSLYVSRHFHGWCGDAN